MSRNTFGDDRFLTPAEFANRLSISRWTVYAWLSEGRIRSVKLGSRLVRIPEGEVSRLTGHVRGDWKD